MTNQLALLRSPTLRATSLLIAGGFGFAVANVLLAKVLEPGEFGTLSLFLALVQLTLTLGPFGLDLAINRHRLSATTTLRNWGFATSLASALLIGAAAWRLYDLRWPLLLCLFLTGTAASFNRFGAAVLQTRQRFGVSLLLGQVHNYVLLLAVPMLWMLGATHAFPVAVLLAVSYLITCIVGWRASVRRSVGGASPPLKHVVGESLAGFGILLATQALWQLERLVIPQYLSLQDLATFAVVAAIAGSPFRMLQIGVGHTLLPGLRACTTTRDVARLIEREGAIVFGAAALSSVAVFSVTPLLAERFLQGRYEISTGLLFAVVVTGLVKVGNGFVGAMVQAFGSTADLARLNASSWLGLLAGVGCASYAARFGVTGIVYGVGVAWCVMTLTALVIAWRALQLWRRTVPRQRELAAHAS